METKKKKFNFNTNAAAEMIESGAGISGNGHDDITGEPMLQPKTRGRKRIEVKEPTKFVQINMPQSKYQLLAQAKIKYDMSLQEILIEGLELWLKKNKD
jgi:hypothetical protein